MTALPGLFLVGTRAAASVWNADGAASVSFTGIATGNATWNADGAASASWTGQETDRGVWNADGAASASWAGRAVHTATWNADGAGAAAFAGFSTYWHVTWNADGQANVAFTPSSRAVWTADGAGSAEFVGKVSTAPFRADGAASVVWAGQRAVAQPFHADGAAASSWHGRSSVFALWSAGGAAGADWRLGAPHPWNADGVGQSAWSGKALVHATWNANGGGPVSWSGTSPGPFFFAWIDPGEAWGPQHLRIDEVIFSFDLLHEEGQCATLEMEVKNPFTGFLAPGRKQWCYFSIRTQPMFKGRLISVPADITGEIVQLHFTAMPLDMLAQQRTLADGLMVRPYWDPVWISEAQRLDPMSVLEGYSSMWHVDRVTLQVTTSDLLVGEDGLIQFGTGTSNDVFYDSVKPQIDKAPLRSVYVDATVSWTQFDVGVIDMGRKTWQAWTAGGIIGSWPKAGTGIGSGWTVNHSLAIDPTGPVQTVSGGFSFTAGQWEVTPDGVIPARHHFGDWMSLQESYTTPYLISNVPASTGLGPIAAGVGSPLKIVTAQQLRLTIGDEEKGIAASGSGSQSGSLFWDWGLTTMLSLRYEAKRERSENVRFMLTADMQPVFTDPGGQAANFAQDSEYLRLEGKVGLEGPYGAFRGDWQPRTDYKLYDIVITRSGQYTYGWQVLRDHRSLDAFDPEATAGVAVAGLWYDAGDNIYIDDVSAISLWEKFTFVWWLGGAYNTSSTVGDPHYWQVLISGYFPAGSLTIFNIRDPWTQTPMFSPLGDPHSGKKLYQQIPQFRGNWTAGEILVGNDMVIAPDGTWYRVAIGHVAAAPFYRFASNVAGQLLYELMLNPPPIGDISRRSYFPQGRGLWSLENLIARARAHIIARSRVLKVAFECRFEALLNMSLRNNVELFDRRLPGGQAVGKVTSYSIKGNGDSGTVIGSVTVSCVAGLANATASAVGTPVYAVAAYAGSDWQYYAGAVTVLGTGDVGYQPPIDMGSAIDDGLQFPLDRGQAVVAETVTVASTAAPELGGPTPPQIGPVIGGR
jgi:hypothetical protein